MTVVQKNQVLEGEVMDLTHEGHGVIKVNAYPIFAPHAFIAERIQYQILTLDKNIA
ncbi:23S rRNA (uracil-5-)-methyltransferase RumA, partial [Staphylococcus chromogenes]